MFPYTGEYEEYVRRGARDFEFYTFTPRQLKDGNFFEVDEELCALLIETHRLLGILEGMIKYMPHADAIRELLILKESYYSRLIDYEEAHLSDVLASINSGKKDFKHIVNIVSAYKFALGQNVNNITLSKICAVALYGHNSKDKIDTRKDHIYWGNTLSNLRAYNPTAPEYILPAIADISAFLSQDRTMDILARAALAHYQFEMIHPYEYYNGIMGRLMVLMILHEAGHQAASHLCLSEFLYYNKNEYFETLRTTQYSAGYRVWVKFFVKGIYEAAKHAIGQIDRIQQVIAQDEAKIKTCRSLTKNTWMVFNYFKYNLVSEIRPMTVKLHLSYNTVVKAVDFLLSLGVLQLVNAQSRHRLFKYGGLMTVFALSK